MRDFDIGETVPCFASIKKEGVAVNADTCKITIKRGATVIINSVDMTNTEKGEYSYDFASAGKEKGYYDVIVTATYGGRTTIEIGGFTLV